MVDSNDTQIQESPSESEILFHATPQKNSHDPMHHHPNEEPDMNETILDGKGQSEDPVNKLQLDALKKEIESATQPEEKLNKSIELMEASLSQSGNPDFKTFWDARKWCLDLFKENIPPAIKAAHWSKYRELTKEAKRLKEIFEERTAFAVEQIEIAIQALEKDISDFQTQLENIPVPEFPKGLRALRSNLQTYIEKQRELNLLNAQAARINALRKELIRTEMRIRQKNKFFHSLSAAGDKVFPRRKELIKEISQIFADDIAAYIKTRVSNLAQEKSLHLLREEIKELQAVAKMMTLNTQAFTQTRLKLSECWDKLKIVERDRKKEQAQQKKVFKDNADEVRAKIQAFSEDVAAKHIPSAEVQKKFDEVNKFMRSKELGRDEVKTLKDELNEAYKPVKARLIEEEKKRRDAELEKEKNRQQKFRDIEEQVANLCANLENREVLASSIEAVEKEIEALDLSEFEKDGLLSRLATARDTLFEYEELKALQLANDDPNKRSHLENALRKIIKRRDEIKDRMEKYRKACGGSGLDFEHSLYFNELLNNEKGRLENINSYIAKLEASVAELKK